MLNMFLEFIEKNRNESGSVLIFVFYQSSFGLDFAYFSKIKSILLKLKMAFTKKMHIK